MALDANIKGVGGVGVEVNSDNQLKTVLETNVASKPGNVGAIRMFSENDAGSVTGTADLRSTETSDDYRLRVGMDTLLFNDSFNATTQNTHQWAYTFNTLTCTQPGAGSVNFATVQGTTSSHGAFMRTFQYFPVFGTAPLWYELFFGQFTSALVANEVWSAGFGTPSAATTLPTDGVWFQLTTAGLIGRICYNGVFTDSGVLKAFGDFTLNTYFKGSILVGENIIEWWVDDILLGTTNVPAGSGGHPFLQASLPAFMMKHNTGAVSNTNTMRVTDVFVSLADINANKPYGHQQAGAGLHASIAPNGSTPGKTEWWTNNTGPTSAAATNTAAIAGATTLGGLVAVQPTLAQNSDGNIFTYQNPAPTINITGRNLYITGVRLQGMVTTAFTGGPVLYAYALAYGHTNVSLATAETGSFVTATAHAPRIIFVGMENYVVTAAVGAMGQGASLDLSSAPICVRPGEFVALIARNMGTVTSAGVITIGCSFVGYWE